MKKKIPPEVRKHMASIGRRGGQAEGASKVRGNSAHYSAIARKRRNKADPKAKKEKDQ